MDSIRNIITKLNPKQRLIKYQLIAKRDGEHCRQCGRKPPEIRLDIDKIAPELGYGEGDDISNLQLLCRTHNVRRSPRGKTKKRTGPPTNELLEAPRSFSKEFIKGAESEPRFRETVYELMYQYRELSVDDLVDAGAEAAACSIQTGYRYLRKLVSIKGDFEMDETKLVKWRKKS
jgi:hypothetical protein